MGLDNVKKQAGMFVSGCVVYRLGEGTRDMKSIPNHMFISFFFEVLEVSPETGL